MIIIKTIKEIEKMREGGRILAKIVKILEDEIKPGITTSHLEEMACVLIKKHNGRPSFKGYKPDVETEQRPVRVFPTALCTSINNEVVHAPALPSRKLNKGDIIGIDCGLEYKGLYTDMAITVGVGKISAQAKRLINATKKSLELAIKQVKPGNVLADISMAIENYIKPYKYGIVRDLVGHGVGKEVHEDPQIPNYSAKKNKWMNLVLKPGMTFAIEPMINIGGWRVKVGANNFTILTADNSLSAHFEHTVAITEDGCEVLTKI